MTRVVVSFLVSAVVVGCSSTNTGSVARSDGGADGGTSTSRDGAPASDAQVSFEAGVTDGPSGGACSAEPSRDGCIKCCSNFHQDGAAAFLLATIDCLCDATRCKADCADTLCATDLKDPDARCTQCANDKDAECKGPVAGACAAEPECVAFDKCVGDSSCANKP
ncbi:MAG: hypothetical protein KC657_24905 [Myxococcales bacterium]|nr:hypothetical protein [Myxococcales bacterium]